jgi:hypothetical protein
MAAAVRARVQVEQDANGVIAGRVGVRPIALLRINRCRCSAAHWKNRKALAFLRPRIHRMLRKLGNSAAIR